MLTSDIIGETSKVVWWFFIICIGKLLCLIETVARRRSATLLSEFGLGHVREYAPFGLILIALHLILRTKSQHICFKCARMALRATFSNYQSMILAQMIDYLLRR